MVREISACSNLVCIVYLQYRQINITLIVGFLFLMISIGK